MTVEELVGSYTIIGKNQSDSGTSYRGELTLSLDSNHRILAKWLINNEQEQIGSGFFKNDILVVNFSYQGEDNLIYKGVVVYKCLTKDILDGFWSEKHGNPNYLGEERCFRIKNEKELVN